jgi:MFS family permease
MLRFFHGAGFSIGTTATATMVAVFSPASRIGEGVGYLAVFTSIAMVIGPFIGLKLSTDYSFTSLFAVCALFGLLAFLCGNIQSIPEQKVDGPIQQIKKLLAGRVFLSLMHCRLLYAEDFWLLFIAVCLDFYHFMLRNWE